MRSFTSIVTVIAAFAAFYFFTLATHQDVHSSDNQVILQGPLPASYPRAQELAPDFSLVSQLGNTVTLSALGGRSLILIFAYAHCRSVCPGIVKISQQALESLPPGSAELLLVTLDPERETPEKLPELAQMWGLKENEFILSGPVEAVRKVHAQYDIPIQKDSSSGEMVHPPLVYVIDRAGKLAYSFNNPTLRWLQDALHNVASS